MSLQQQDADMIGSPPVMAQAARKRWWVTALQVMLVLSALAGFAVRFYVCAFPGYLDRDGSDMAQVARNISTGQGFTTNFIRPFNTSFVEAGVQAYPEINHAPAYPYTLAAFYSILHVSAQGSAQTSALCHILVLCATVLLGALLFNVRTGLLGAAAVGLSKPMLETAISGHEWPMAGLWFTLLLCAIASHHRATTAKRVRASVLYAGLAAIPFALLYATHYGTVCLAVPIAIYFAVTGTARRSSAVVFLVASATLISPLVYANYSHTQSPLLGGVAWNVMANTSEHPGDTLYRSIDKGLASPRALLLFPIEHFASFATKLLQGSANLFSAMLPALGLLGLPFAAVSALYRFKHPQANAVRSVCYGSAAVMLFVLAALGASVECVAMFCPAIAVISAAYLFLLLDAKRLHPVFARFVLIGVVLITGASAIPWVLRPAVGASDDSSNHLPVVLAQIRAAGPIYTDQPWAVAWGTTNPAVWLPATNADISGLADAGLPLHIILMTRECEKYRANDIWRVLYTTPWWRTYTNDPKAAVSEYLKAAHIPEGQIENAMDFFRQQRRQFSISAESLGNLRQESTDPLSPNDIQIMTSL